MSNACVYFYSWQLTVKILTADYKIFNFCKKNTLYNKSVINHARKLQFNNI